MRTETTSRWRVAVDGEDVDACLDAADERAPVLVLAHGAGGHLDDGGMRALASLYRRLGLHVVRFDFPYRARGSRRPDAMPLLQRCIAAVVESAAQRIDAKRWIIGGRSLGGRAASMLAAGRFGCDGVLLLAYPLHPAGAPEKLRDAHLARIDVPVLCINGTRDSLCRRDLMDAVVARLPGNFRMRWIEGADHSFHVTQSSGLRDADVLKEIGEATLQWMRSAQLGDGESIRS